MEKYFDKLYTKDFKTFIEELAVNVKQEKKTFVITANPETLMIGTENEAFDAVLKSEDSTIVADGIGVVKAAHMLNIPVQGRVPGVEIVQELFKILNEEKKSLYLLGAKPNAKDEISLGIKIVYDADIIKESFGEKTEKEYKELIWEDIKEINKTLPVFKKIKEVIITTEPLEKTTTQKIKRFKEIEKILK